MLRFRLLGTLDIRRGEQPLPKPPTVKSQSLLAYLVCHRRQPTPRERLAELFWGDRPEAKSRQSLASALWHVRRCLSVGTRDPGSAEGCVLSDASTVQLDPLTDLWCDAEEFEALVSRDDPVALDSAVALYRGDFLDGFFDDWIISERYRLEALWHTALARLMTVQEATGAADMALTTAQRLLRNDPLREDAHRVAMRAYCSLGQRNAALQQFGRCCDVLAEELGVEPTAETTDLHRAILEGRYPIGSGVGWVSAGPPPRSSARPSGRSPLDAIAACRLAGREQELELLEACWRGAVAGGEGVVLLGGEAGVGKTRLVAEFANRLRWQGHRVLWGQCYEFERELPYQPLSAALRAFLPALAPAELGGCSPQVLAGLSRLAPEALAGSPAPKVRDPPGPAQDQEHLFEGVAGFIRHLCFHGALLVVIEDLQWASESTLQMLHFVARHLAGHPLLLLGTLRDDAVGPGHPLRLFQAQARREGLARAVRLSRLSVDAVRAIVLDMSGAGPLAVPLAERLYRETEGNPFFLMEIVRALFDAGQIGLEAGAWHADWARLTKGPLPLPATVVEAVQIRVEALGESEREALCLAAVLGYEFDFDLLNAVWGRGDAATLETLDTLLRRRLLDEGSGPSVHDYAFSHHQIREVVYAGITRRRRQRLHAQAGDAIERLCSQAERETLAAELAYHFEQGQLLDRTLSGRAVAYLLHAGDRAQRVYAHEEAADFYNRALRLLKAGKDQDGAARVLLKLGLAYHNSFDFRQARRAYAEGCRLWQRSLEQPPPVPLPSAHLLRLSWQEPESLDPARASTWFASVVTNQLFSGLVELSPEMDVLPDVARGWDVLDGGRRYLFYLRDDVLWSDGTRVIADDFVCACEWTLDPARPPAPSGLLCDIKGARAFHAGRNCEPGHLGVHAIDEHTLEIELERPTGYFLYLLATTLNWGVPRRIVREHGATWCEPAHLVTNGPFRLADWQAGECLVLTRNPSYHGQRAGNAERVELRLLPEDAASTALEMYAAGRLDSVTLWRPSAAQTGLAGQCHPGELLRLPRLSTSYLSFDTRRPPFDDVRVRRAFAQAVDRETLADVVLQAEESPATGGFVPPGMPGHSAEIGLRHDPGAARRLLAEAGFAQGRGFPQVPALAGRARQLHVGHLQSQWRQELGVDVPWGLVDNLDMHGLRREEPALFVWGWLADYPDPHSFLRQSSVPSTLGWGNEACERLVDEASREQDQPRRIQRYREADRLLIEEARIVPLTYGISHLLVKPWVRRYPASAIGSHFWKHVLIDPRF